jgi:predicted phage terminase large subunit-like protein
VTRIWSQPELWAAREMARQDLYFFNRWMFLRRKGYAWRRAPHHPIVCEALTRVFTGEITRLIINIPPRYSKTELVKGFVAWGLGHQPDSEFIYTSYSGRLAAASSWDVRSAVLDPEYRAIFPQVLLREDSQAKDEWRTTKGGILYAVGAGGTITGYGAGKDREGFGGAIIIDDPHKADEARSDVIRQNVVDWFSTTLESRKNAPARTPIILIMQRLHEEDLAGELLAGGNGETWHHVCLSAWKDEAAGLPLWPEKHSAEELRRMEKANPYTFAGQYRQQPAPPEGGVIKPDLLVEVDAIPCRVVEWCRGWDLGASEGGDFTVGIKVGKLADGRYVLADGVRDQLATAQRDQLITTTANNDGFGQVKQSIPQDPGQAGKSQVLYLAQKLAGHTLHFSTETGDKVTRADPLASQINAGNVLAVRGPWLNPFKDECRLFPNGKYDDQVDAAGRGFNALLQSRGGLFV